ncbi:hypothetical protein HJC23_000735 [Cyclotella cryptica]|uniref:Uncharacterized protein n=1 Tax=Cyclotella cryptica TaxID=29204 RepID=A0ABD3QAB3_9STRA|eukprot:CCRYP_007419-RA/>CCRYP_007419-RA protein AED:0.43 eAED:0.43 QI:0/-1/0/1/-1/1/1/0/195
MRSIGATQASEKDNDIDIDRDSPIHSNPSTLSCHSSNSGSKSIEIMLNDRESTVIILSDIDATREKDSSSLKGEALPALLGLIDGMNVGLFVLPTITSGGLLALPDVGLVVGVSVGDFDAFEPFWLNGSSKSLLESRARPRRRTRSTCRRSATRLSCAVDGVKDARIKPRTQVFIFAAYLFLRVPRREKYEITTL